MDLLVRGGTVVTAAGSRRADVVVDGGRIVAILSPEEGSQASERATEVARAEGLLVLPGASEVSEIEMEVGELLQHLLPILERRLVGGRDLDQFPCDGVPAVDQAGPEGRK